MSLTAKDIAEIARLLDASHFSRLDLQVGDFRLKIRRDGGWSGGDEDGRLFLLQSRPETVWAMKEAKKPVAEPKDNPLAHVMGIFSGGKR